MATPHGARAVKAARSGHEWTAPEVRALNDASPRWWPRYECADGRLLVTPAPAPPHQTVVQNLLVALTRYLEGEPVGVAWMAPGDISWGRPGMTLQPDVYVTPLADARAALAARDWAKVRELLLVAEVLSRGTATRDRGLKRQIYQRRGVPQYWVVDTSAGGVEEWTPRARRARALDRLVWHPPGAAEPFVMELAALFAVPWA